MQALPEDTGLKSPASPAPAAPARRARFGLSGKLLVLTILVVALTEVMVLVPTIANFRTSWLSDRLAAARIAALVLDAAPEETVPTDLTRQLLASVGAKLVVVKKEGTRRLLAMSDMPPVINEHVDMREATFWDEALEAFETLIVGDGRLLRLVGDPPPGSDFLEIVISETPLRHAMLRFAGAALLISLAIALIAGALVYLALNWLFVVPMRRLTERMTQFREAPEDASRIITPSGRSDEIGTAEEALADLQRGLSQALHQKNHLAALGLAVSKINHDLRNLLASAQLLSDRLATLPDPAVQRFAPKLMAALDRAISYCEQTLSYGRAQEPLPERRDVDLSQLVGEVRDTLALYPGARVDFIADVPRGLTVDADPDQLFRVLLNLSRNALQALEARGFDDPARDRLVISARREARQVAITVSDTGPGIPADKRGRLFEAFNASARRGGTGLGLPIADELVRAHGGELKLLDAPSGTAFRITIPDRPERQRAPRRLQA